MKRIIKFFVGNALILTISILSGEKSPPKTKLQPLSLEKVQQTFVKQVAAITEKIRINNHRRNSGQEDDFVFTYPEAEFSEWECVATD